MRVMGRMPLLPARIADHAVGYITADWRNDTEPGNDDTSLGHTILVVAEGR